LRRRSYGNKAVEDIGDFVAHPDERDEGASHRGIQNFLRIFRFHWLGFGTEEDKRARTHQQLAEAAFATLETVGPAEVKKRLGVGQSSARKILKRALARVFKLDTGFIAANLTQQENKILRHFTSRLVSFPAFTDAEVEKQFLVCLAKNGLIESVPTNPIPELREKLAIFTIRALHLGVVIVGNDRAILQGGCDPHGEAGAIGIWATMSVSETKPTHRAMTAVYMCGLDPERWLDPQLANTPIWPFPLEVGPAGKLQMLQ
jgi:hypothetical protein